MKPIERAGLFMRRQPRGRYRAVHPSAECSLDDRHVDPAARTARRQPFSVDPDLVDRALRSHATTQEALAAAVEAAGRKTRSPVPGEPVFDLAWEDGHSIAVAEVKSLTESNEEKQLRLALGQVLRYAHLLPAKGRPVQRVIAAEREPTDPTWLSLCEAEGVTSDVPEPVRLKVPFPAEKESASTRGH